MVKFLKHAGLAGCLLFLGACEQLNAGPETPDALAQMQEAFDIAASTQGDGNPAIWKMSDDDTTIYIYGTFHLLPEDLEWQTDEFNAALAASDTVYLEIDMSDPTKQQEMAVEMFKRAMFSDGNSLETVMTEKQYEAFYESLEPLNISEGSIDGMKPWFASLQIQIKQMVNDGFDPNKGVEMIIIEKATQNGAEFGYFETIFDQLDALSAGSMEDQIEGLLFGAQSLDQMADMTHSLMAEWADGDTVGLDVLMGDADLFGSQESYDAMIVNRNQKWIPQIEAILDDPGTKFVAVGAGHLAGPDSVLKMLEAKGYTIETVQ